MAWEYIEPLLPGEENGNHFNVFSWYTRDCSLKQK